VIAARIQTVGIVGLGRMGRPIARCLLRAGFSVRGVDPDPAAAEGARHDGVVLAPDCAELARLSDSILVLAGFESQVEQILFGPQGIVAGAGPGAPVMIASTVSPSYMRTVPERLAAIPVLDTPVARGEKAAESGSLLVYAGGDSATLARCQPILEAVAERVFHLGAVGAGQAAKAINNMLLWSCVCATVEGLDLGDALGIDRESLREALCHGSGANWAMETRADERPALWAEKDMAIVLREAEAAGVALPMGGAVREAISAFKVARNLPAPSEG